MRELPSKQEEELHVLLILFPFPSIEGIPFELFSCIFFRKKRVLFLIKSIESAKSVNALAKHEKILFSRCFFSLAGLRVGRPQGC